MISRSWKRNLLAEGIEPNPGPSWAQFVKALEEFIGDDEEAKRYFNAKVLPSLKTVVQDICNIQYVDTTAILQVIENKPKVLLESGIDAACCRAFQEVIQGIEYSNTEASSIDWKYIQQQPQRRLEPPPEILRIAEFGRTLKFMNREKELKELGLWIYRMFDVWLTRSSFRASYDALKFLTVPIIGGQSGLGKTTMVAHTIKNLGSVCTDEMNAEFIPALRRCLDSQLYLLSQHHDISHFWNFYVNGFDTKIADILATYQTPKNAHEFVQLLDQSAHEPTLLFVHLDEAQQTDMEMVSSALRDWLKASLQSKNICVIPIVTGTNIRAIQQRITGSGCRFKAIFLSYLKGIHYQQILKDLFPDLNVGGELQKALSDLEGPPRLFLLFLSVCTELGQAAQGKKIVDARGESFMVKPVDVDALRYFLTNCQNQKHLRKAFHRILDEFAAGHSSLFSSLGELKKAQFIDVLLVFAATQARVSLETKVHDITINDLAHQGLITLIPTANEDEFMLEFPALYVMYLTKSSPCTFVERTKMLMTPDWSLSPTEAELSDCNTMMLHLIKYHFLEQQAFSLKELFRPFKELTMDLMLPIPDNTKCYLAEHTTTKITSTNFLIQCKKIFEKKKQPIPPPFIAVQNADKASFGDWFLYWPEVDGSDYCQKLRPARSKTWFKKKTKVKAHGFAIIGQSKCYEKSAISAALLRTEYDKVQGVVNDGIGFLLVVVTDAPKVSVDIPQELNGQLVVIPQESLTAFFGRTAAIRRVQIVRKKLFMEGTNETEDKKSEEDSAKIKEFKKEGLAIVENDKEMSKDKREELVEAKGKETKLETRKDEELTTKLGKVSLKERKMKVKDK